MQFAIVPLIKFEFMPLKQIGEFQPYIGSEDNFQKSVARYLDALGVLWFHCPNGGSRNIMEAAKMKAMGVKPGIPDVLILELRQNKYGLALELKVGKNKLSEHQEAMRKRFIAHNWAIYTVYSLDHAISIIDNYFS
jgi:hypothetical protein